jgi:hypothetical protein
MSLGMEPTILYEVVESWSSMLLSLGNVSRTYEFLKISGGGGEPSRMTAVFPDQLLDLHSTLQTSNLR